MHELSIAESVVQIASRQANGRRVTKVQMKLGHLRQVVPSALAFSFELVAKGTPVEGAELEMEEVPATGMCRECGMESRLSSFPLQCQDRVDVEPEAVNGHTIVRTGQGAQAASLNKSVQKGVAGALACLRELAPCQARDPVAP